MIDITVETFWQNNVVPSSTSYAMKETLEEAQAFAQSQAAHYNAQGFTVVWAIFQYYARIDGGESKPQTLEQAWAELQAVPSYVEQTAQAAAHEFGLELAALTGGDTLHWDKVLTDDFCPHFED